MIHTSTHSADDLILNPEIFKEITEGSYVKLYDPERPQNSLILRVPALQPCGNRLEVSLSKTLADPFNLKAFSRIVVERMLPDDIGVDFVELAFRKQFLQRGNMWRFKKAMFGRCVHIGQNITVDGVQAQIQEVGRKGQSVASGLTSEETNFIFRSRCARIKWLVQISAEMWEYDQNGDLYFEKFLNKFVDPLLDRWKALSVTHSLSVIFFARTLYIDNDNGDTTTTSSHNINNNINNNNNNNIDNYNECPSVHIIGKEEVKKGEDDEDDEEVIITGQGLGHGLGLEPGELEGKPVGFDGDTEDDVDVDGRESSTSQRQGKGRKFSEWLKSEPLVRQGADGGNREDDRHEQTLLSTGIEES
eukprot:gene4950-9893_t